MEKKAIIIGAGPAGLTAAYELLKRTDIKPVILEKSGDIGGISKTVNYKGNRIDIGGHRFFSKSDRVMNWWLNIMPIQAEGQSSFNISYQHKSREINTTSIGASDHAGKDPDKVMLVRRRLSRIYFLRKFFTYPIQLSLDTLTKLGLWTTIAIMFSYLKAQLLPRKPEKNLEDFMINRFGQVLYKLFFKDYTEKVWGIPCDKISAEWGAQRIKGVSISKAIQHAIQSATKKKQQASGNDIAQKDTETSLIEQFLYPKFGPGQLWEEVARQVESMGGKILMHHDVKRIYTSDNANQVTAVAAVNNITGETSYLEGDYFFSTMPVQELIGGLDGPIPEEVREVAAGLQYRDFITVGILLKKLSFQDKKTGEWKPLELKDTWIYIQEKDVKVGRLQLFNNWSPYMVKDPDTAWVGMEFFCNQTDDFWNRSDEYIKDLAIKELEKIGLASQANVLDATVLRMEKTYPAYFGTYERFDVVRDFVDKFENLFLVGRNGMHKYNNSDHSMLTAMVAVDNIVEGVVEKERIWEINTEQEYHEEREIKRKSLSDVSSKNKNDLIDLSVLSFKDYISSNPVHRWLVTIGLVGIILQLVVFKYLYPYASFINGDSYVYMETAYLNLSINTYPVGYSNFLRLFSVFTKSDTVLVIFQYLLLQSSILGLLFTTFYIYRPGHLTKILLFGILLFNPVFLFLANYVSSDSLFLSLSLIWFTQLIWIANRPSMSLIVINAVILFLAFMVRYNALYYPLVTIVVFISSRQYFFRKVLGLGISVLLIGCFILFTSSKYEELTGERQFTPFSGWQMANNAMYAYRYIDSADLKVVPHRFRKLDAMVRTYFDTSRDVKKYPHEAWQASTVYMWSPFSPLQMYMEQQFKKDSSATKLKKWATVGPLYSDYGKYLIKQYPLAFARYYLWPNMMKYYTPPVEFLEYYNMGTDSVAPIAAQWFGYKDIKVKTRIGTFNVGILSLYPVFSGVINILLICSVVGFFMLNGNSKYPILSKGIKLILIFWIINFSFSVFASPIALRFQLFPVIVTFLYAAMAISYLIEMAFRNDVEPTIKPIAQSLQMAR
ncbi:NAD(P)/FAD-dependent oxidoreductase [uncultured Chitinophaga sp.]|jgi:Protoporphyrinogen oxidase|uniref:NAD(P)/FAD-dependent oxidoreductase n=1 Tax=uncultured Chitinophaga sp. TaxID=339340 RepID=UPI00261F3165|nr:NAD(P)/FAD-dependent oxidoreductase [uncultured Chitinophaga sp.]